MNLIDTHCHLNLEEHFADPSATIAEAHAVGVGRLIVVGIDLATSRRAIALAEQHPSLYATIGIHPNSSADKFDMSEIEALVSHPKVVAIGEIGLDYHWDYATKEQQFASLHAQLDLADRLDKPVVFHCREAYDDLLTILEARRRGPWLLHCFSGSQSDADRAIRLGCTFGVDGPITYPKAGDLRQIVGGLSHDRLVVETDSPYLTPVPFRGKPNRPSNVVFVNRGLADCLGLTEAACSELTTRNAERFFRLP